MHKLSNLLYLCLTFAGSIDGTPLHTGKAPATQTRYLIIPEDSASLIAKRSFEANLTGSLGNTKVHKAHDGDELPFWLATLKPEQVEEFQSNPLISAVVADTPIALLGLEIPIEITDSSTASEPVNPQHGEEADPDPTIHIASQSNAPAELKVLSQGHDKASHPFPLDSIEYQYDSRGGRGITVYLLDTGATPKHVEYTGMPGTKRWLFAQVPGEPMQEDYDDPRRHGTAVLSKISGPTFGAAKNVDVVIAKVPLSIAKNSTEGHSTLGSELWTVLIGVKKDVEKHKLQGKAVVNVSLGYNATQVSPELRTYLESAVRDITSLGVPFITSAGNMGRRGGEVYSYPQLFAAENQGIVLVGSVDDNGVLADHSSHGPLVELFAPGQDVLCALPGSINKSGSANGTSFASPAVAGLAAEFLAMKTGVEGEGQELAENMKRHLLDMAYPRVEGEGKKVAWSGLDGRWADRYVRSCKGMFSGCTNETRGVSS